MNTSLEVVLLRVLHKAETFLDLGIKLLESKKEKEKDDGEDR